MFLINEIGNYKCTGTRLGKGNFGRVQEAVHKILKIQVALKVIRVDGNDTASNSSTQAQYVRKNLYREAKLLNKLSHPCIVTLFETLQCRNYYVLVLESVYGGDLLAFLKSQKSGRFSEKHAWFFAVQLVSAVAHMHSRNVVHRDLKMENILLNSSKTRIKIVDFGLSNEYSPRHRLQTFCGSPEYAAPELYAAAHKYGPEIDIWSLGVVLYALLCGRLPFRYRTVTSDWRPPSSSQSLSSSSRLSPTPLSPHLDVAANSITTASTLSLRPLVQSREQFIVRLNRGLNGSKSCRNDLSRLSADSQNLLVKLLCPVAEKRIRMPALKAHRWINRNGQFTIRSNPFSQFYDTCKAQALNTITKLLETNRDIVDNNDCLFRIVLQYKLMKALETTIAKCCSCCTCCCNGGGGGDNYDLNRLIVVPHLVTAEDAKHKVRRTRHQRHGSRKFKKTAQKCVQKLQP